MRLVLVPLAMLWLLAWTERHEGVAYVVGLGLAWTLELGALAYVRSRLLDRSLSLMLCVVEIGVVLPSAVLLSLAEYHAWPTRDLTRYRDVLAECLVASHVAGGVWVLTALVPDLALENRMRRVETHRLRVDTELATLRARLTPHFTRNTLNAVASMIETDPEGARELLAQLADLLDASIEKSEDELESIADHVAWLTTYTKILETRYRDLLRFEWKIDPAVASRKIPKLLLQPLVENAVEHGALRAGKPTRVRIAVEGSGADVVVCRIEDDGPGFPPGTSPSVGLVTARRRFDLFAPEGTFAISSSSAGTSVTLAFPRGEA